MFTAAGRRSPKSLQHPSRDDINTAKWLTELIVVKSANAQLFACAESVGADVRTKVVNNRPYPITLELSARPKSSQLVFERTVNVTFAPTATMLADTGRPIVAG